MALSVWASHWCERATFVTPALGLGRGDRIGSRVAVDLRRPGPSMQSWSHSGMSGSIHPDFLGDCLTIHVIQFICHT